jgi:hypothetical protein
MGEDLSVEVARLRRAIRVQMLALLVLLSFFAFAAAQPQTVLRTRALIVEDEDGHDRIVLGAPVADPKEGHRTSETVGLVINDAQGFERFGVGLQSTGRMVMGLDAPVGTGDDRNRERITLVADERGGSMVNFLDRKTAIRGRLALDADNRFWLEFLDVGPSTVLKRRIGLKTDVTSNANGGESLARAVRTVTSFREWSGRPAAHLQGGSAQAGRRAASRLRASGMGDAV